MCGGTGYKGRLPVFEFLVVDNEIAEMIIAGRSEAQIRAAARKKGYGGLLDSGVSKMLQGLTTAEEVKAELLRQLCSSVQWQRSVEYMVNDDVSAFIEIGPGKVLSGLIRRISKYVKTMNIGDAEAIKSITDLFP